MVDRITHHRRHRRPRTIVFAAVLALLGALFTAQPALAAPAAINLFSSSCPPEILQGQNSGCVTELQNLLNKHGAGLTVDGDFGGNTLTAVRNFQSATAIGVDGRVGPQTKTKLYSTSTAAPSPVNLLSASCPSNLVRGANSGCVTELQNLLNRYGASLVVDGDFGGNTEAAVRSFQSKQGLGVDGQVGPLTKAALYNLSQEGSNGVDLRSSSCPANIVQGMTGGCVKTLQALLNGKGQSISVDGEFGPNTLAAVRAFQASAGIGVDGEVGPQTKAALYSNIGGGGSSGAPAPINLNSSSCPSNIVQGAKGGCVTELQSLLNHHGASLAVDGDFGPLTKSEVMYFQSRAGIGVDGQVGPQTKAALYGAVLPPEPTPPGGGASNIVSVAESQLGIIEGTSAANKYGSAVGLSMSTSDYAWCATFVSWVLKQTGASSYRSTWVGKFVDRAREGTYNLHVTTSPRPGDLVAFSWDNDDNWYDGQQHIGIIRTFTSKSSFTTVEGNTGRPGGGSDGVWSKTRGTGNGYGVVFIRVG